MSLRRALARCHVEQQVSGRYIVTFSQRSISGLLPLDVKNHRFAAIPLFSKVFQTPCLSLLPTFISYQFITCFAKQWVCMLMLPSFFMDSISYTLPISIQVYKWVTDNAIASQQNPSLRCWICKFMGLCTDAALMHVIKHGILTERHLSIQVYKWVPDNAKVINTLQFKACSADWHIYIVGIHLFVKQVKYSGVR